MRHTGLQVRMAIAGAFVTAFYGLLALVLARLAFYLASFFGVPVSQWQTLAVAVVAILAFVVFQWRQRSKYLLRGHPTTDISSSDEPWLHERAETLSAEIGVEKPRLVRADLGEPNAFSFGRRDDGTVVFSTQLLTLLDSDEIEAVLVHELVHLRNRDSVFMVLGYTAAGLLTTLLTTTLLADENGTERTGTTFGDLINEAVTSFGRVFVLPFVLVVSRHREYVADEDAVRYVDDPEVLARALEVIARNHSRSDVRTDGLGRDLSALCIHGHRRSPLGRLFDDHPDVERRVERIRTLADRTPANPLSADVQVLLNKGEWIAYHARPSYPGYALPRVAGVLLLLSAGTTAFVVGVLPVLAVVGPGVLPETVDLVGLVADTGALVWLVGPLVVLPLLLGSYLPYRNEEYLVTSDRIVRFGGLVGRGYEEVDRVDVSLVDVSVGPVDRLLGTGTVEIRTPFDDLRFRGVKNPHEVALSIEPDDAPSVRRKTSVTGFSN